MYQNQYNYPYQNLNIMPPPYVDKYGRQFFRDNYGYAYNIDQYGNAEYLRPLPFLKRHFLAVRQYKTLWMILTFLFITPVIVLTYLAWNAFIGLAIASWYIIKYVVIAAIFILSLIFGRVTFII